MPGDSGGLVVTRSRAFFTAREAAGASGTRHSPHPRGWKDFAKLGRVAPRERGFVSDEHVRSVFGRHRPPPGRANARPMTGSGGRPSIPEASVFEIERLRSTGYPACARYDNVARGWC